MEREDVREGTERQDIREGMKVRGADGENLGSVIGVGPSFFIVEKGLLFTKDYEIAYGHVETVTDDEVRLRTTRADLTAFERDDRDRIEAEERPSPTVEAGAPQVTTMPLAEEELSAEKRVRQAGEVEIRKDVETQQKTITVPVTREEVHVERVPASPEQRAGEETFEGQTIRVPVTEEEVEIRKHPVVREELRATKEAHEEEEEHTEEVRKESARVSKPDQPSLSAAEEEERQRRR